MRVSDLSDPSRYAVVEEKTGATAAEAPCPPYYVAMGYRAVALGTLGQHPAHWVHPAYVMLRRPTQAELFGLGEFNIETSGGVKIASFNCKPSRVAPTYAMKHVLRKKPYAQPGPYYVYRDYYHWAPRTTRR